MAFFSQFSSSALGSGLASFFLKRPVLSVFGASAVSFACYSFFTSSNSKNCLHSLLASLPLVASAPSYDAVTVAPKEGHFHSSDGPFQLMTVKKSNVDAPAHAPAWLLELFSHPEFELIDLRKHLDPAYHLLYGSLHKKHGIESYYLFIEKRPASSSPSAEDSNSTSVSSSNSSSSSSTSSESSSSFAPHVYAVFHVGAALCGHRNIIHGGLTAALIDDISGAAVVSAFGPGQFTVNLQVNYLAPIPAESFVLVRGQAWKQEGRKTSVRVSVEDGEGKKYAEGTALYVKPKEGVQKVIEKAHSNGQSKQEENK